MIFFLIIWVIYQIDTNTLIWRGGKRVWFSVKILNLKCIVADWKCQMDGTCMFEHILAEQSTRILAEFKLLLIACFLPADKGEGIIWFVQRMNWTNQRAILTIIMSLFGFKLVEIKTPHHHDQRPLKSRLVKRRVIYYFTLKIQPFSKLKNKNKV